MTAPLLSVIGILLAAVPGSMLVYHGGDALESGVSRARTVSAVMTVVRVVQLHDLQEGSPYEGPGLRRLVNTRCLRTLPANPSGGEGPRVESRDGRRVVSMPLSGAGEEGCRRIETFMKRSPSGMTGCYEETGDPVVYATI